MQEKLVLYPTDISQWHALINEAEVFNNYQLAEELESYLVFLLMRFCTQPEVVSSVLAMDFLNGQQAVGQERFNRLRDLGDKSLLFSGLFPGLASKKRVNVDYFITMGQSAYDTISKSEERSLSELFSALSEEFIPLKDVLDATRKLANESDKLKSLAQFYNDLENNKVIKSFQMNDVIRKKH